MSRENGRRNSPEADTRSNARKQAESVLCAMIRRGTLEAFAVLESHHGALLTHVFDANDGTGADVACELAYLISNAPPLSRVVVMCPGWYMRHGVLTRGLLSVEQSWRSWWDVAAVSWLVDEELEDEEPWHEGHVLRRPLPPGRGHYA